jgi:hypothetical protein
MNSKYSTRALLQYLADNHQLDFTVHYTLIIDYTLREP